MKKQIVYEVRDHQKRVQIYKIELQTLRFFIFYRCLPRHFFKNRKK